MIVDALVAFSQPIFVYIPPHAELRGGAWVVVDPTIHSEVMEMYAASEARGGVLEPNGAAEIKFREKDYVATAHRLDRQLQGMDAKMKELVGGGEGGKEEEVKVLQKEIKEREVRAGGGREGEGGGGVLSGSLFFPFDHSHHKQSQNSPRHSPSLPPSLPPSLLERAQGHLRAGRRPIRRLARYPRPHGCRGRDPPSRPLGSSPLLLLLASPPPPGRVPLAQGSAQGCGRWSRREGGRDELVAGLGVVEELVFVNSGQDGGGLGGG